MRKQRRRSAAQISAFVFAIRKVQSLDTTQVRNLKPLAIFWVCTARFAPDLVGIPEDRFSHDAAHLISDRYTLKNKNLEVHILNYGGIVKNILMPDKDGKVQDIALGYDTLEGRYKKTNALIGHKKVDLFI